MIRLGVNIDHVATLRQARRGESPNPLEAAFACEKAGAHGITMHLREDRRHIQDKDVLEVAANVLLPLNLEMALAPQILKFALKLKPDSVCIVPERREELTTEGGLDVIASLSKLKPAVKELKKAGVQVSIFVSPDLKQIEACRESGAEFIELNTGEFSEAKTLSLKAKEVERLEKAALRGSELGLKINAGHGLNYQNVLEILHLKGLHELNIGHAIISRAIMTGLERAVIDMLDLMNA